MIDDISRRPSSVASPPSLILDYKAFSHGQLFASDEESSGDESGDDLRSALDMPLSLGHSYRAMQAVLFHSNRSFIDEMFQWILPRWSFRQVPSQPGFRPNSSSSDFPTGHRRVDFNPTPAASRPALSSRAQPNDAVERYRIGRISASEETDWSSPRERDLRHGPVNEWAASMLNQRHHDVSAAAIEDQLAAIQHRRRERQRQLVSHLDDGSPLHGLRAPPASSIARSYGWPAHGREPRFGSETNIEDSYAMCPYCNKYGGKQHQLECQLRPVDCSWCGQRMRYAEFPYHATICRPLAINSPDPKPRRRSPEMPKTREEPPQASPPPPEEEPLDGRRCMWCSKVRPKSHDPECPERRVACSVCHQVVFLREKKAHRAVCQLRDNPKKELLATRGTNSASERDSQPSRTVTFDRQRDSA